MQSSQPQQTQSQQQPQRIVMLPSRHIPESLVQQIVDLKDFSLRFINGYRNIIQLSAQSQTQWALTPNQDYCGQAFCYLLKPTVKKQELIKKQVGTTHNIVQSSQEMFVVQSVSGFTPNDLALTSQQLNKLIEQIAESKQSQKLAINLIKNAFESFQGYNKTVGQLVQKLEQQIQSEGEATLPTVGEALSLQENANKIHGQMVKNVPKINRETGLWDQGESIQIKLNAE